MATKLLIGLSFLLVIPYAFAENSMLYQYELRLVGVTSQSDDRDKYTESVVDFLRTNGLQNDCVDVKREYLAPSPKIRVLMRSPINTNLFASLEASLCSKIKGRCKIDGEVYAQAMANLQFAYTLNGNPLMIKPQVRPRKVSSIAAHIEFPVFSSSCESGKTDESIFFSARSSESRSLLKRSGLDINRIHSFMLVTKNDGQPWWGFGRPDVYWNNRPVTKHNQELAPKEILDDLL
jgi:hypothetical protein